MCTENQGIADAILGVSMKMAQKEFLMPGR